MEYTIDKLAKLAGISTRTLRYYDEIGLLKPGRIQSNGYRIYGGEQVDLLQQILFYRQLDVPLDRIRRLLMAEGFDSKDALEHHLTALLARRKQLDLLIGNVKKSIAAIGGEIEMKDREKFEGLKERLVEENEAKYGVEIREKYGDEAVDATNEKIKNMTQEQYSEVEALSLAVNEALKLAFEDGDPEGELAQNACRLHEAWLRCYWKNYSRGAHAGLAQTYAADPRFAAYYDEIAPGCAVFLRDALMIYCEN